MLATRADDIVKAVNHLAQSATPETVPYWVDVLDTAKFSEVFAVILTFPLAQQKALIQKIIDYIKKDIRDDETDAAKRKLLNVLSRLFTSPSNPKFVCLPLILQRDVLAATDCQPEEAYSAEMYLARGNVYIRYRVTFAKAMEDFQQAMKRSQGVIKPVNEKIEFDEKIIVINDALQLLQRGQLHLSREGIRNGMLVALRYLYEHPADIAYYVKLTEILLKFSKEILYLVIKTMPEDKQLALLNPVCSAALSVHPLRVRFLAQENGNLASMNSGILQKIALRVERISIKNKKAQYGVYEQNKYYCDMGDMYLFYKRADKAKKKYEKAAQVGGNDSNTHGRAFAGMAKCNIANGLFIMQTAVHLRDALRAEPKNREYHLLLANEFLKMASDMKKRISIEIVGAIFHLHKAYEFSPTSDEEDNVRSSAAYIHILEDNYSELEIIECIRTINKAFVRLQLLNSCLDKNTLLGGSGLNFSAHEAVINEMIKQAMAVGENITVHAADDVEMITFPRKY